MNVRFYNAKILCLKDDAKREYQIVEGELWVSGDSIAYIGDGSDTGSVFGIGRSMPLASCYCRDLRMPIRIQR